MSKSLDELYVATCDEEIAEEVRKFGGKPIMTSDCHERCTDRVAEAVEKSQAEIVVIIQGDEPMISPEMIDLAVDAIIDNDSVVCVNLMEKIESDEDFYDPNEVKVIVDKDSNALYFSREPIPSDKKGAKDYPRYKQVCIMPFRKEFLYKYNQMEPTPLEIIESVDMLRILEHGYKVKMVFTEKITCSVDTPEDLAKVEKYMVDDELINSYV
jgi:3-deoxy-manno-octulosonate cytidylyltransferase (CMP-KDO synthetase)